jgi:glycosyltransferase involved in cell wall biosynthesis
MLAIDSPGETTQVLKIAVIIPCYNEENTIATVVRDFRASLPTARIFVYDNNSSDQTIARAGAAGAVVRGEPRQGKGNVVRRMFSDIEADVYIMVDGDGTYEAAAASKLVETLISENLDMVVGRRIHQSQQAYRPGHVMGNKALTKTVELLFGKNFDDMLSGYRVLSRRFVKSFPLISGGFEIETEMAIHALALAVPNKEIATAYDERSEGSVSKLSTYKDGVKILLSIMVLLKNERPFFLFGVIALLSASASLGLGLPVIEDFFRTGLVERLPTAVLAASLMVLAFISLNLAFSLDSLRRFRAETKRLHYLSYPSVLG